MREIRIFIGIESELCSGCAYTDDNPGGDVFCRLFGDSLHLGAVEEHGVVRCDECKRAEIEPAAPRLVELLDTAIGRIEDYVHETKMPFPHEPKGRITIATDDVERLAVFVMRAIQGIHAVDAAEVHIAGRAPVDGPQRPRAFAIIESLARITERWDEGEGTREVMAIAIAHITKKKVADVELPEGIDVVVAKWNHLQIEIKGLKKRDADVADELYRLRTARESGPSPMMITTLGRIAELVDPEGEIGECLGDYGNGDFEKLFRRVYAPVNSMARIASAVGHKIDNYDDVWSELADQICALAPELKRERKRTATLLDILVDLRGRK